MIYTLMLLANVIVVPRWGNARSPHTSQMLRSINVLQDKGELRIYCSFTERILL